MCRIAASFVLALAICGSADTRADGKAKKQDPVALAALETSTKALEGVRRVRYDVSYLRTSWLTSRVPSVEGTVTLGPTGEYDVPRFFAEVTITPHEGEPVKVTAGCNGDEYYFIDPKTKTAHQDMDPGVMGTQGRNVNRVLVDDFRAKKPFEQFLEADELSMLPPEVVDGETCLIVEAKNGSNRTQRVALAERDGLPRRYERIFKNDEGEVGEISMVLTNLQVNVALPKDAFLLKVPIGYTKSTDFAP